MKNERFHYYLCRRLGGGMEICMKTKAELLPECPVATTVQLIGNKWKLLIIRICGHAHGVLMNCRKIWTVSARKF